MLMHRPDDALAPRLPLPKQQQPRTSNDHIMGRAGDAPTALSLMLA